MVEVVICAMPMAMASPLVVIITHCTAAHGHHMLLGKVMHSCMHAGVPRAATRPVALGMSHIKQMKTHPSSAAQGYLHLCGGSQGIFAS
jgi:hypothetical protein